MSKEEKKIKDKAITISNAEREALVNSLISVGINERLVKDALGPVSEECLHGPPTCQKE